MTYIKLVIMAILWAGGFISAKVIANEAGPLTITFFRFLIATVILAVIVYRKEKDVRISPALMVHALGAAVLGVFCYNYLFFTGIRSVDAGRGAVMISTVPVIVAVLSRAFLKERIGLLKWLGILISLLGAWVLVTKGQINLLMKGPLGHGEILLVLSVFCAAAFTMFSRQMLKELSPLVTMVYIAALGTVLLFVPALFEMQKSIIPTASPVFLFNLFYLAAGPSVVAVVFYYEAIKSVGISRAAQYMNLIPVFSVVLAALILREPMTTSLFWGGGLVTIGLYLTSFTV